VGTWERSNKAPVSIACGSGRCCHSRTTKDLFHTNNLTNGTTCYSIVWSAISSTTLTNFTLNNAESQTCHTMASCTSRHPICAHIVFPLPNLPSLVLSGHYSVSLSQPVNIFLCFISVSISSYCLSWVGLCSRFQASVVWCYLYYFLLSVFQ
jgi:hypothetical protein